MLLCWVHRESQQTILHALQTQDYWKSRTNWLSNSESHDAADLCVSKLDGMLDRDSPQVRDRGLNIFDIPWPAQLKATKDAIWSKMDAALDKKYKLLSARVIVNVPGSTGPKMHRDMDSANTPPIVVVFMLPLVDVTEDRAPTEIKARNSNGASLLLTSNAGKPYAFDGYARHRGTANCSKTVRPVLVFDCCLKEY
jgi:hypothetical protein